jgi:glucosamine-phosphate N-acetyltransferase
MRLGGPAPAVVVVAERRADGERDLYRRGPAAMLTLSPTQSPKTVARQDGPVARRLRREDFDRGFVQTLQSLRPSPLTRERFDEVFDALGDHCRVWVLEVDGAVAATATLLLERKFLHGGSVVGHVEDVAVGRAFQGRRLGKRLLAHVLSDARAAGCYKVILNCDQAVAGFYEGIGFHKQDVGMRIDLR